MPFYYDILFFQQAATESWIENEDIDFAELSPTLYVSYQMITIFLFIYL